MAIEAAGVLMLQSLVAFAHLIVRNQKISAHDGGGGLDGRRRDGARDKSSYEIWGEAECTKGGREGGRAAAPIVRVDIVVGGSGFGHQTLLGTERGSEGGLGAGEWSQRESMTNFI